jgi:diguanylate cyclase (GGDEF)-like protein
VKPAPFTADETGRLMAVRDLGLLDTPPERRFDRVVQLAARFTASPIAIFSLVDESRVFLKSVSGASAVGVTLSPPHREYWFCSHVVASGAPVAVRDARVDDRFDRLGIVTGSPSVVSYAGVPIRAPQGPYVGALAVLGLEARDYSDEEMNTLLELAKLIEAELSSLPHSAIDTLTGALTARTFVRLGNRLLELSDSRGQSSAVLRLDIKGTTAINSQFGFEEGDLALVDTAQLVGSTVRGSDLVGRVGPDEFAVLLLGAQADAAKVVLDRLREATGTHNATAGRRFQLAFQVGVSEHAIGGGSDLSTQLVTAAMVADLEL